MPPTPAQDAIHKGVASGLHPEACLQAGELFQASRVAPFGLGRGATSPPTPAQDVFHKGVASGLYPEACLQAGAGICQMR